MKNVRVQYQTIEFGKIDIHLCTLRNRQEFSDPNGVAAKLGISSASWPIFGVVWPSSIVLANYMLTVDMSDKRVLEIGCGTALTSLLLNKCDIDITATDHHPEAGNLLARNVRLNDDSPIQFSRVDWADTNDNLGLFDVIVGSDLLYEDEHIELLAAFMNAHANQSCEMVLVDPGRGRKNKMIRRMEQLGYTVSSFKPSHTDYLEKEFKGHIMTFSRAA